MIVVSVFCDVWHIDISTQRSNAVAQTTDLVCSVSCLESPSPICDKSFNNVQVIGKEMPGFPAMIRTVVVKETGMLPLWLFQPEGCRYPNREDQVPPHLDLDTSCKATIKSRRRMYTSASLTLWLQPR